MNVARVTGMLLACLLLITSCHAVSPAPSYNPLANMVAVPLTELPSRHHVLTVDINNVPGTFLLDTGANRSIVRESRLSRFHIERAESHGQARLINLREIERGRAHDINSLSINNIPFPLGQILSANLDHLLDPIESVSAITIDGVLGMDALLSLGTLLDIRTVTLYIEPID